MTHEGSHTSCTLCGMHYNHGGQVPWFDDYSESQLCPRSGVQPLLHDKDKAAALTEPPSREENGQVTGQLLFGFTVINLALITHRIVKPSPQHCFLGFFFCFLRYWGLNSGPSPWAIPPALFVIGFFFEIGFCELFALGWLRTSILLISASWVARVTGVSRQCLAQHCFLRHRFCVSQTQPSGIFRPQ
jgi:hypothetical protein